MCRHRREKGGVGERGRTARPHQRSQKPGWGETGSNVGYVCERVGHSEGHRFTPRRCKLTEAVFARRQLLVPDRGEEHEEEDQAGEEQPEPSLRLHICL